MRGECYHLAGEVVAKFSKWVGSRAEQLVALGPTQHGYALTVRLLVMTSEKFIAHVPTSAAHYLGPVSRVGHTGFK